MLSSRMVLAQMLAVVVSVAVVTSVSAQPNVYAKCRKAKILARGKWQACRSAQRAKIVVGGTADYAKCDAKLAKKLVVAEKNVPADNIWICHWVDNNDGTVSDLHTGLMWEKKDSEDGVSNLANPHDVDNTYYFELARGNVVGTSFLGLVNGQSEFGVPVEPGLGGYRDWRLPYVTELQSIFDDTVVYSGSIPCGSMPNTPCIRQQVFGPTVMCFNDHFGDCHYQASTINTAPGPGFHANDTVDFSYGGGPVTMGNPNAVRAVRGGDD